MAIITLTYVPSISTLLKVLSSVSVRLQLSFPPKLALVAAGPSWVQPAVQPAVFSAGAVSIALG